MEEPLKRKELRRDRHTVSLLTDHIVFSPKYRGKVLVGDVAMMAEGIICKTCVEMDIEIIEIAVNPVLTRSHCGIRTGYAEEMPCKVNGCSGTLKKINHPVYRIGSYPGKGVDMDDDFEEWSDDALEARYDLVKEFDQMVDDCIAQFKYMLDNFRIVEKVVPCTRTIRVVEPIAEEG